MDFLKELRLRRAARLLRGGDQPVKLLAAAVGYGSRSSFSHAVKELFGVAPADYRAGESGEGLRL